jgi:hypothetical protein
MVSTPLSNKSQTGLIPTTTRPISARTFAATMDIGLFVYLAMWYAGNYQYNIYNKLSSKAAGGAEFAFTLAWLQLVVGSVYGIFLWAAPDARAKPNVRSSAPIPLPPYANPRTERVRRVSRSAASLRS